MPQYGLRNSRKSTCCDLIRRVWQILKGIMKSSKVYLVGAGPGDPGLLTVKGRDVLQAADCVLYDYLVSDAIVKLARPAAEMIFVGKQGGKNCITQDQIHDLLLTKAREHQLIVRLKGGDPFIFGRGGEEAETLAAAGIAFEIVPGISSGIAAPAYAGIPLTYRGYSSSVAFITAHENPTRDLDEARRHRIATNADTLVFFMGVARINQLVEELYAQGRAPQTPVAVIRWGTTPQQEVFVSDLENIAALMNSHDVKPPALIVVGEVVQLRDQLQWYFPQASAS
jgi:uroporphyrinogen III methyltransferase / synthase